MKFKFKTWDSAITTAHPKSKYATVPKLAYYTGYDFNIVNEQGLIVFKRCSRVQLILRSIYGKFFEKDIDSLEII